MGGAPHTTCPRHSHGVVVDTAWILLFGVCSGACKSQTSCSVALPTAERGHGRVLACLLLRTVSCRQCTQACGHSLAVASVPYKALLCIAPVNLLPASFMLQTGYRPCRPVLLLQDWASWQSSAQQVHLVLQAQVQGLQGQQALLQEQLSAAEASVQEAMEARQLQTERIKASKAAQKAGQ